MSSVKIDHEHYLLFLHDNFIGGWFVPAVLGAKGPLGVESQRRAVGGETPAEPLVGLPTSEKYSNLFSGQLDGHCVGGGGGVCVLLLGGYNYSTSKGPLCFILAGIGQGKANGQTKQVNTVSSFCACVQKGHLSSQVIWFAILCGITVWYSNGLGLVQDLNSAPYGHSHTRQAHYRPLVSTQGNF